MNRSGPRSPDFLPGLPMLLLRPATWLPAGVPNQILATLCNQIFAQPIRNGEFGFLTQRRLRIRIEDAGLDIGLRFDGERLHAIDDAMADDVCIQGAIYEFALLVTRQEDPDTLFFQRRLRIEGNTELGLHLKNFLDAWEPPAPVRTLERLGAALLARLERGGLNR